MVHGQAIVFLRDLSITQGFPFAHRTSTNFVSKSRIPPEAKCTYLQNCECCCKGPVVYQAYHGTMSPVLGSFRDTKFMPWSIHALLGLINTCMLRYTYLQELARNGPGLKFFPRFQDKTFFFLLEMELSSESPLL